MSYQFEDDSALEELLNQQLDRRKQQTSSTNSKQNRNSNRPTTGLGVKSSQQASSSSTAALAAGPSFPSGFSRPSTASSSLLHRQPQALETSSPADELASSLPPSSGTGGLGVGLGGGGGVPAPRQGKTLSSWLQEGGNRRRRDEEKVASGEPAVSQLYRPNTAELEDTGAMTAAATANTNREVPRAKFAKATAAAAAAAAYQAELDNLLSPSSLQDMSKQRLIQVILEEVVPRLNALKLGLASGAGAGREGSSEALAQAEMTVNRLKQELQMERNRVQLVEMRQEEWLELERQKWQQINQQLESRLASSESQMGQLLESQREHSSKLDEQYQSQLAKLTEIFDQRLNDEKRRFEELLKSRDEMHRLELEAKLNVNADLMQLDTRQLEWRRTLETTINQLADHYKSVESLLEKQAIQVNGTNSELAKKAQRLCDQYDNYDQCNQQLAQLANKLSEQLMPRVVQTQANGESVLVSANDKLAKLDARLDDFAKRAQELERTRLELVELGNKMNEDRFKLALDSSRVSMKEERLDELVTRNSTNELQLSNERKSLNELQAQLQLRRLALDERFADLKEQNYSLHLLRRRLTVQREELLAGQVELAEERKAFRSNKSQMDDELKRLNTLRTRVSRELEQLRRLQRSLVCSLCMSRLFDGGTGTGAGATSMETINVKQGLSSHKHYHQQQQQQQQQEPPLVVDDTTTVHHQLGFLQQLAGEERQQQQQQQQHDSNLTLGRLGVTLERVDVEQDAVHTMTMPYYDQDDHDQKDKSGDRDNNNNKELDLQRKQTELDKSRLAAESRYVEQLFGGGELA